MPQLVKLTYLEGISTWGPTTAEGVLEFSFAEGFLHLEAAGLPRLVGQAYEGWLVRSSSNEAISVGQFNAAADETVVYEAQLPPISDYSLDFFVLTVESLSSEDADPSRDRSIGGFFNLLEPQDPTDPASEIQAGAPPNFGAGPADGTGAGEPSEASDSSDATGEETTPGTELLPDRLPETGDGEGFLSNMRGMMLILAGGAMLAFAGARTRRRARRGGPS